MQVAKAQSNQVVTSQSSFNKPATPDWQHIPETPTQPLADSSNPIERSGIETFEDTSAMDDDGDSLLLFSRNVFHFPMIKTAL